MKYTNIENIFPEIEPEQVVNEEDLYWIQIQHLLSRNLAEAVERLVRLYEESPDLIVSTILLAQECKTVQEGRRIPQPFPYTVFARAIKEKWRGAMECVEAVCAADKSGKMYVNMLYRVCFCKTSSVQRMLDILEQFLNFKESRKHLRNPTVWGLCRQRVGVWDVDDQDVAELISEDDIDIYALGSRKLECFRDVLHKCAWRYVPMMFTAALRTPGVELEKAAEYTKLKDKPSPADTKLLVAAIFQKCEAIRRFHEAIVGSDTNDPLFSTSSNDNAFFEPVIDSIDNWNLRALKHTPKVPKGFQTIGEYEFPCFLDGLLMRSLVDVSPHAAFDMAGRLATILKRLFGDTEVKTNFREFVINIYNQDRAKESYDEKNNCSDVYALNSAFVLLEVSGGIFRHDFVTKIGVNKFATFCFFYTMRLFEVSTNNHIREFQQTHKVTPLLQAFFAGQKCLASYFRFVLDVVNTRRAEVFMPVTAAIDNLSADTAAIDNLSADTTSGKASVEKNTDNQTKNASSPVSILDRFTALLDLSFEDAKAVDVGEIIKDKEFITTFLLLQEFSPELFTNPKSFTFFSTLLIFKNTFHTAVIRAIVIHKSKPLVSSDSILLQRLVRCYTDRFIDSAESNRFLLNMILVGKVVPNNRVSLRMVNAMVADLDTHLRSNLDAVIKINELRSKIVELEDMRENTSIPDDLSEDEEARYLDDGELAALLRNASDVQIRRSVELYLQNFPTQRYHDIYEHFKAVSLRDADPLRYRLHIKIKINKGRLESQEKNLDVSVRYTNSFFNVLIDFTSINRKLFLNRNIFNRLCTIINGALMALLGPKRGMYRLDRSKTKKDLGSMESNNNNMSLTRETYNPRLLLVSTLRLIINLVSRNKLLITRSAFSADLLRKGLQIVTEKSLFSAANASLLSDITSVLVENSPVENPDEDIPEHFIDSLTCNLMEHPVRITTSNVIVDKSTFNQIMLNDATDPFSRLPLTESSYEECLELQQEINDYLNKKKDTCQMG